jgi:hypothetical protein
LSAAFLLSFFAFTSFLGLVAKKQKERIGLNGTNQKEERKNWRTEDDIESSNRKQHGLEDWDQDAGAKVGNDWRRRASLDHTNLRNSSATLRLKGRPEVTFAIEKDKVSFGVTDLEMSIQNASLGTPSSLNGQCLSVIVCSSTLSSRMPPTSSLLPYAHVSMNEGLVVHLPEYGINARKERKSLTRKKRFSTGFCYDRPSPSSLT